MVIIDEAQTIENERGYLIELLLMKLHLLNPNLQVVLLSATLPCPLQLASWLSATLFIYECHFSQMTSQQRNNLVEYTVMNNKVYQANNTMVHELSTSESIISKRPGTLTQIHLLLQWLFHTNKENSTVLVFCPTKARCEDLVKAASSLIVEIYIQYHF